MSVQASRTGSGRERPSLQSPRRARSTPRGCRRRLMGTRAVWQAVSGLCLAGSYLSDAVVHASRAPQPGVGGRTARLWLQPTPSTYLYMFFQIRFQTSARRLIRSDLSDGIGRIQIRPHILGPDCPSAPVCPALGVHLWRFIIRILTPLNIWRGSADLGSGSFPGRPIRCLWRTSV